jgi:N-methylhydantoinase A/oxoprolinase/acetone carboxylase beta subunit
MNFHEKPPQIRIGVDVGGTFTKAVALRLDPIQIIAQAVTPTTHADSQGVARGILQVLSLILADPMVKNGRILAVSHSTTQAVNALLEGDVATVGIIGSGPLLERARLRRRVSLGTIPLAPERGLRTYTEWLDEPFTPDQAAAAIQRLRERGVQTFVASSMYAVDEPAAELSLLRAAAEHDLPAIAGHQVSGSYGLEVRTLTAAINASIIPKMVQTTAQVEACLQDAGITAPLLVMRGDGGLNDAEMLRTRPILSLLSGPAASVAGALLFARMQDGIFIEVGGTSTNLALIQDGQPVLRYVQIMDRPTTVRSLDVRVQGVAGGSLARLRDWKIVDIGPRSAHIAGLPYVCYSQPEGDLSLELFAPQPGDPKDYVCIVDSTGERFALTVTCAANALGKVPATAYANANREVALRGFELLGQVLGTAADKAAELFLRQAAIPLLKAIRRLARDYRLKPSNLTLIGGGGGSGALVPFLAEELHTTFRITDHAEVISSIGVALALVRDEVEGGMDRAPDELMQAARTRAIQSGATPESVQVTIENVPERSLRRAIATGAFALDSGTSTSTTDMAVYSLAELCMIVAKRAQVPPAQVSLVEEVGALKVFQTKARRFGRLRGEWSGIIVITESGSVRARIENGTRLIGSGSDLLTQVRPDFQYILIQRAALLRLDANAVREVLLQAVPPFVLIAEPESVW